MRWRILGCMILAAAGIGFLLGALPGPVSAGTTPPINLSGTGSYARHPAIARATDGTLCAAWTDNRDGPWNIYYSCSVDNGRSWSLPGRVYSSVQESLHPTVLFSGTVPVFAWTDDQARSVFTIYQRISATVQVVVPDLREPAEPSLVLDEDGVFHLVFAQRAGIYYVRRPSGDGGWESATQIFTATLEGSLYPRIAASPSRMLHVVWLEGTLSGVEIRYITGTVASGGGVTWSPSVTVSNLVSLTWQPDIALTSNGDIHVVWTEEIADNRYLAYARFQATGGRTSPQWLGGPFRVNENNPFGLFSVVDASGNRVCVAWNAIPEGQQGEDIYLMCSDDGGNTWMPPENVSRTPEMSIRPSIIVAPDGSVHIVWQEFSGTDRDYHYRVYYTRWLPHNVYLPLVMRNAR